MVILVTNQSKNRVEVLTSLHVNRAYKEDKKDAAVYGIFNNKLSYDPSDAFATYTTKKRAEEVMKEIIEDLQKPKFVESKVLTEKLPNGFEKYASDSKDVQVYVIKFPEK